MDSVVQIWKNKGAKEPPGRSFKEGDLHCLFLHIVSSCAGDTTLRVWNVTKFQTDHVLWDHSHGGMLVILSCNNNYVLSDSADMAVRTWDTTMSLQMRKLKGHSCMVWSVAFSSDLQHIASVSYPELCVWNIEGVVEHKLKGIRAWVAFIAFSYDGCYVVLLPCVVGCGR